MSEIIATGHLEVTKNGLWKHTLVSVEFIITFLKVQKCRITASLIKNACLMFSIWLSNGPSVAANARYKGSLGNQTFLSQIYFCILYSWEMQDEFALILNA